MGRVIIKAAPDQDLYVEWSTIVEAPTWIADRAGMLQYLHRQDHEPHPLNDPEGRLARADETGTSAAGDYSFFGAWDDEGIIFEQRGSVPRDELPAFLKAFQRDDTAACHALLEPFEDDPPTADAEH